MSTISFDDVGQDLRRIMISGQLDAPGAKAIASQLLEFASEPKKARNHVTFGMRWKP